MSSRPRFATMEEYFAAAPPEARPILSGIRAIVERVAPDATPTISYQMPAFRRKRVFVYFAAFKSHIGVFPPVHGDEALDADLAAFRGEKGNLRFPYNAEMPYALIERVVARLAEQYSPVS